MQPVERGRGSRPILVVVLLVVIVAAGIAGRLGGGPSEGPASPGPTASASIESASASAGSFEACPAPAATTVRAIVLEGPRPTGTAARLATVAPSAAWLDLVADATGHVWALARGRIVRLAAGTLAADASWSYTDSPVFAPDGIAPAANDGVWIWDDSALRHLLPTRIVDVVPLPAATVAETVAETRDGSLWVVTGSGSSSGSAILHWDGHAWSRIDPCPGAFPAGRASLAVDPSGRLVVADGFGAWVRLRRYDGATWMTAMGMAGLGDPATAPGLAIDHHGVSYVSTGQGIGRFDGAEWATSPIKATRIDVLADGSLAVVGPTPLGDAEVLRLDSGTLAVLPGAAPVFLSGPVAGTVTSSEGLIVATPSAIGTGLSVIRFPAPGRSLVVRGLLADVPWLRGARDHPGAPLLALSRGEAWFGSWQGVAWHLLGSTLVPRDVSGGEVSTVRSIARDPSGTIWIGHDADLTLVRPNGASIEIAVQAVSIATRGDGSAWLLAPDGTAFRAAPFPSGIVIDALERPPFDWGARIVADADGSAWALGGSLSGPNLLVAHLVGAHWRVVPPPTGAALTAIAPDAGGGIWGLATRPGGRVLLERDEGSGWRSAGEVPMLGATDLAVARSGTVWVAGDALARTDGAGRWETVALGSSVVDPTRRFYAPSVARDGTLYVVCPSGICRVDPGR